MGLWSPSSIETELWLDASDAASVIIAGGTINTWNDKSGHNRHAVGPTDTGLQPVISLASLNGLNTVRFATDQLSGPLFSPQNAESVFVVYKDTTGSAYRHIFTQNNPLYSTYNDLGVYMPLLTASGGAATFTYDAGDLIATVAAVYNVAHVFSSTFSGSQLSNNIDGGALVTVAAGLADDATKYSIGSYVDGTGGFFTGLVAEIIVLSTAASLEDRQLIEGYLGHKWGVPLAIGHPYKDTAPIEVISNQCTIELTDLLPELMASDGSIMSEVDLVDLLGGLESATFNVSISDVAIQDYYGILSVITLSQVQMSSDILDYAPVCAYTLGSSTNMLESLSAVYGVTTSHLAIEVLLSDPLELIDGYTILPMTISGNLTEDLPAADGVMSYTNSISMSGYSTFDTLNSQAYVLNSITIDLTDTFPIMSFGHNMSLNFLPLRYINRSNL